MALTLGDVMRPEYAVPEELQRLLLFHDPNWTAQTHTLSRWHGPGPGLYQRTKLKLGIWHQRRLYPNVSLLQAIVSHHKVKVVLTYSVLQHRRLTSVGMSTCCSPLNLWEGTSDLYTDGSLHWQRYQSNVDVLQNVSTCTRRGDDVIVLLKNSIHSPLFVYVATTLRHEWLVLVLQVFNINMITN